MSNTDVQLLEQLKLARDKVVADIVAGKHVTMLQIGSKSAQYPAAQSTLDMLERMISKYSRSTSTKKSTNRARLRR